MANFANVAYFAEGVQGIKIEIFRNLKLHVQAVFENIAESECWQVKKGINVKKLIHKMAQWP